MQCGNCGQTISQQGSKFCPFCGVSLPVAMNLAPAPQGHIAFNTHSNWSVSGVTILAAATVIVTIATMIVYPRDAVGILIVGSVIFVAIGGVGLRNRCRNCGRFFTMKHIRSENLGSKKTYTLWSGRYPRQIVVLRTTWKETFECSHCNHQQERIFTEDNPEFSE